MDVWSSVKPFNDLCITFSWELNKKQKKIIKKIILQPGLYNVTD